MIFLQLYIGNEWDTTNICWNFYAVELMDTYVVFKEYAPNGAWLACVVSCYQKFGPNGPVTSKCILL